MKRWEAAGLSARPCKSAFSHLKVLYGWLGKASMLRAGASYLDDPEAVSAALRGRLRSSWTAQGVDPLDKIAEIAEDDPDVARVLRLQQAFGLRVQEASLLNPARDVLEPDCLRVVAGTKGGRPRAVPIETEAQRALLREAEKQARRTGHSMIPPQYDLKQWLTRCYTVLARHGVTCKHGLVTHGLRHQYANDRYEELTGEPSPVRGACRSAPTIRPPARNSPPPAWAMPGPRSPTPITAAGNRSYAAPAFRRRGQTTSPRAGASRTAARRPAQGPHRHHHPARPGRGPASTQALRARLLNRMLADLLRLGVPLSTPDALSKSHVDALLRYWRQAALTADSQRQRVQLLAQLCEWLDQPELAVQVRNAWCRGRGRGPAVPLERGADSGTPPGDSGDRCARRLASGAGAGVRNDPPSGRGAATGNGRPRRCPGRALGSPQGSGPAFLRRRRTPTGGAGRGPPSLYRTRRRRSARPNWRWTPGCAGSMTSCAPSAGSAFRVNQPCGHCRTVTSTPQVLSRDAYLLARAGLKRPRFFRNLFIRRDARIWRHPARQRSSVVDRRFGGHLAASYLSRRRDRPLRTRRSARYYHVNSGAAPCSASDCRAAFAGFCEVAGRAS